jgi:Cyclin, N-terminal domain
MVDWMCEVMSIAFKNTCTDQTFFLAVSIMDRYIQALEDRGQVLMSSELHLTGVACMFIASKYEDVNPLLMRTVFNKIGHQKLTPQAIIERESEILLALSFKIGGAPTSYEFVTMMMECVP